MKLTVHAVAGKMPGWVDAGVAEYLKRLPRELSLSFREVPLARRRDAEAQIAEREGEALLRGVAEGDYCIALDPRGTAWDTQQLAGELERWMMNGRPVSLLIGGPDGLADACLARADRRWSLGPLTLPHTLVRVVLAEQLYRAWTITIGHPYHRA